MTKLTNKIHSRRSPLWAAVFGALLAQGCATPSIQTRQAQVELPSAYQTNGAQSDNVNLDEVNGDEVNIDWAQWFNDPVLTDLVQTAINNNQEAAIILQRINMAANEVYAREGEYLPQVTAGAEGEFEKVGEFTREGAVEEQLDIKEGKAFPDPLGNLRLGLNASWELDVWHKLRDASKVASYEYLASIEGRKFFITQLVSEVSRCYYELIALDNQLVNLDSTIDVQQNVIKTISALKQFGRTSSLPIARFTAEIKKNESERFLVKQDIVETENRLNVLLGRVPQPIARNSDTLFEGNIFKPEVGVPSALLANRSDIREAELALKAANLNIDVAKANFYPSFGLKAGLGLSSFDSRYLFDLPESLAYTLSADIFSPLINRRAIEATYQNASAEQIQAAFEYEATIVRAVAEVSNSLSKLDNLEKSVNAKTLQIASLEESIDVANKLFASAHGEYLEVLLAQRETLEARSELIEARRQQLSALVDLYQALGGGWQS